MLFTGFQLDEKVK